MALFRLDSPFPPLKVGWSTQIGSPQAHGNVHLWQDGDSIRNPIEYREKGFWAWLPWWVLFWWGCDSVSAKSSELPWLLRGNHRQCQEWQRWQWKRWPGQSKPPWMQENNPKCPIHSSSSGNPPFLGHYYSGRSNAVWGQRTQAAQRRPELLKIDQYLTSEITLREGHWLMQNVLLPPYT